MWILLLLLFVRVMYLIVLEYRRYFPPDFTEGFLIEREAYFWGMYSTAFYLHIATGPIVLLIAVFLMLTGAGNEYLNRFAHWHRPLGKLQFVLVVFLLAPTGIVMSVRANTGAIAGAAFFSLSTATAFSMLAAVWRIRQDNLASHRRWATRCLLLLCSPLLLRLMQGAVITLDFDSQATYPYSAWISWTLPLMIFEISRLAKQTSNCNTVIQTIRPFPLRGD
jgi:uncharacterized membrane protein YozB (DUF420 family)